MKKIEKVLQAQGGHWVGDGFPVRSLFSYDREAQENSPFLLFDYAGPYNFPPATTPRGVGQHARGMHLRGGVVGLEACRQIPGAAEPDGVDRQQALSAPCLIDRVRVHQHLHFVLQAPQFFPCCR